MAKDKQARRDNRITVMAIANMLAAIVDTMRHSGLPHEEIHDFLDGLQRMNLLTLSGPICDLLAEFVDVVRATVPVND